MQNIGDVVTECLSQRGYDGLVTFEGGEGDIGDHDTWVMFDPDKLAGVNQLFVAEKPK